MALTQPARVLYRTERSSTLSRVPLFWFAIPLIPREARVEDLAQALAEHAEPERHDHDHQAGEGDEPPRLAQHALAQRKVDTPVRRVGRQPEADEAEACLGQDGIRYVNGEDHHDRGNDVRENVPG